MRTKWHLRYEPTPFFSESPAFRPKSTWKPPLGYPNIDVFLSQLGKEIFTLSGKQLRYSNLSKEECQAVHSWASDRNIVIKKADKGSCVVIWDCLDYIMDAEKQLSDKTIFEVVTFNKKIIGNLTEKSNKMFEILKHRGFINLLTFIELIVKTHAIWENHIFSLKFINCYQAHLGDLWYVIVEQLLRKYLNFYVKTTLFVMKNNLFEFNGQIKQQISGTAIGIKCAQTYACIYMDKIEGEFLEKQEHKPFTWLQYINIFLFGLMVRINWKHSCKILISSILI